MANRSPIFPICEPQHFSDYGFDPQIDFFQVLEEARKHKRESSSARSSMSIESLHFKLQKPISRDDYFSKKKIQKSCSSKRRWWKNALLFFRWKWAPSGGGPTVDRGHGNKNKNKNNKGSHALDFGVHCGRAIRGSLSAPIYITDSTSSGSSSPYPRTTSRPSSGPLAGTLTPVEKDEVQIPYINLREFDMDHHHQQQNRVSTSAMPIYLVT